PISLGPPQYADRWHRISVSRSRSADLATSGAVDGSHLKLIVGDDDVGEPARLERPELWSPQHLGRCRRCRAHRGGQRDTDAYRAPDDVEQVRGAARDRASEREPGLPAAHRDL